MLTDNREPIDIDLSITKKQRFRINGDNNAILELDISDFGIINRFSEIKPKLKALAEDGVELEADKIVAESDMEDGSDEISDSDIKSIGKEITDKDKKLREYIDYIFDSNVSEVCAPTGTMFDIINGMFRYEYIIDRITKLYKDNIATEFEKVAKRVDLHTNKYTKKTTKKK